jgi:hypothetical protein
MRILVTLSLSESKRLIAKGVASLDIVQNALKNGLIAVAGCTTNAFIIEELTRKTIGNKGRYSCGILMSVGPCLNAHALDEEHKARILDRGQLKDLEPNSNLFSLIDKMDNDDVVIKSGNALDPNGKAGVMVGDLLGGEIGQILPAIVTRGINLIVPMTISKTIPVSIDQAVAESGIFRVDKATGMRVGLLHLPGSVFTEINAVKELTKAEAIPIATGSTDGEISTTLVIKGTNKEVEEAWNLINNIKGEPRIIIERMKCKNCFVGKTSCQFYGTDSSELPKWLE